MRQQGVRTGAVLIVVLGVLTLLALLATTFATLQATERRVARNYMDTVRAKLLAQSGVQAAESLLSQFFPGRALDERKPWMYWGKSVDERQEPGIGDKLEEALNPSFAIEADGSNVPENPQDPTDANVRPYTLSIEGARRGVSGILADATYALNGNHYAIRVSDLSGRIHVNDGVDGGPSGSVSQNLRRILNRLGDVVLVPELGDKVLAARPRSGYRHARDLLAAVGGDERLTGRAYAGAAFIVAGLVVALTAERGVAVARG